MKDIDLEGSMLLGWWSARVMNKSEKRKYIQVDKPVDTLLRENGDTMDKLSHDLNATGSSNLVHKPRTLENWIGTGTNMRDTNTLLSTLQRLNTSCYGVKLSVELCTQDSLMHNINSFPDIGSNCSLSSDLVQYPEYRHLEYSIPLVKHTKEIELSYVTFGLDTFEIDCDLLSLQLKCSIERFLRVGLLTYEETGNAKQWFIKLYDTVSMRAKCDCILRICYSNSCCDIPFHTEGQCWGKIPFTRKTPCALWLQYLTILFSCVLQYVVLVEILMRQANDVETNPGPLSILAEIKIRAAESRRKKQDLQSERIRAEIILQTNKVGSPARQLLKDHYKLTELSAAARSDRGVEFSFTSRTRDDGEQLVKECKDGTFGQHVREHIELPNVSKSWELIITLNDIEAERFLESCPLQDSGFCEDQPDAARSYAPAASVQHSRLPASYPVSVTDETARVSLSQVGQRKTPELLTGRGTSTFSVINNVIIELLKNKKHTEYDLHVVLKTHNKSIVCLLMLDENGFNMLHQCVEQNRIQFMKVFQAHGYWAELIEQEVPRGSSSEFAGCTPKQMAERKRLRRLVREIERLTQQEKSMSDRKAFLRVCRTGDVNTLRVIRGTGKADMKAKDSEGNNAVHWAAVSGNLETVEYLVRLGILGDLVNDNGQTPLHVAVMYGQSTLINFLSTEVKLDLEVADKAGKTPLQKTAENGDVATLSELLKCNVTIDQSLGVIAAQYGRYLYLQHLLTSYRLDHLHKNAEGKTCLMIAAENGHLMIVKFLLSNYEYKLRDVSKQNRSVFHYVADKGHADVAKYLLEKARPLGIVPDVLNQKDHHRIEQLCSLVRGVDKGRAAWHYVKLKRKFIHLFQKCTKGGRVDASKVGDILQSGWGQEPEMEVLKKSIERHKETGNTNDGLDDLTPLMLAVAKGHTEVAKLYIEAGADVKSKDCFGQTGMHLCAMRGTLETAVLLDDKCLELTGEDEDGDQPIKVAEMNEHPEMVNFFKGEEYLPKIQDFVSKLPGLQNNLNPSGLQDIRHSRQDVMRHVVDSVRGLNIDINELLKGVGSGPVLEESTEEYRANQAN